MIRGQLSLHVESVSGTIDEVQHSVDKAIDTSQNDITCAKNENKQIRADKSSLIETIDTQYEQLKDTLAVV